MSIMLEVYYKRPWDHEREDKLTEQIAVFNGRFDCREESELVGVADCVCLTYEFTDWEHADYAAQVLRAQGEHVEGPMQYGD